MNLKMSLAKMMMLMTRILAEASAKRRGHLHDQLTLSMAEEDPQ